MVRHAIIPLAALAALSATPALAQSRIAVGQTVQARLDAVVTSYAAGATGAYSLSLQGAGGVNRSASRGTSTPPSGGGAPAPTPIAMGETAGADLSAASPRLSGGRIYACYVLDSRSGPVTIDVMSGFIDTYAEVGTGRDCGDSMRVLASDDDSGDNTNARVSGTFNEPRLLIRATTYASGVTGRYFVRATPGLPAVRTSRGSLDALPTVENTRNTDVSTCAAAYGAMEDVLDRLRRYGNVGSIDYAARERQTRARATGGGGAAIDFMAGALVLRVLNGFTDNRPEQVSEYLALVAACDQASRFTPVTRFR